MGEIKFIHVADLHLDSPFKGISNISNSIGNILKESTFLAFDRVIDSAINEAVDFVLIAGDLFDLDDRSIRAQIQFKKQIERLINHEIDVFICYGNHDYLPTANNVFTFHDKVHIFGPTPEKKTIRTKSNELVNIYSFSYNQRHIIDRKIEQYEIANGEGYHIGMLHGQLQSSRKYDMYAPFTIEDLLEKKMDYWALGHIHKREILVEQPPIVYPGNIQGRHKNEEGVKGGYIVELDTNRVNMRFFETSIIIWLSEKLDGINVKTVEQLFELINEWKNQQRSNVGQMCKLEIINIDKEFVIYSEEIMDLIESLNEKEQGEGFIYFYSIELTSNFCVEALIENNEFYAQIFSPLENEESNQLLLELNKLKHPARLELNLAEMEELNKRANDRLRKLLRLGERV